MVSIKLYCDGVVAVGGPGIIANPCTIVTFPLCLSSKPFRYVVGSSECEVVGCKDPVVFCASCVPVVRHGENLVLM